MNAQKIFDIIESNSYEYYGIRIEDRVEYNIGDYTNKSRIWDNGNPTENTLNGTSCIGIPYNSCLEDIVRAITTAGIYYGTSCYLIAGNSMEFGEDAGEYIIQNAEVVEII